jgi:hypothetical protein
MQSIQATNKQADIDTVVEVFYADVPMPVLHTLC